MQVENRLAIVTGGGSGLGAATARALAAKGAKVAVFDRDAEKGQALADDIGGLLCACDVADPGGAEAAIETATAAFGPPAVLVNCAGIGTAGRVVGREGPMPLENFERVIRVNLVGTFNMIRLVAARMSLAEPDAGNARGVIVSTASVAAFEGQIGQAAYAASKGGIAALTLPVARELARFGIRVLTVAPGLFKTPLLEELPEETQAALGAAIPFPARLGDPGEFAGLVLAMIDNDYLNGETVRLDGALRMQPK
ncbi:SDR family NAD(P)-dependent oxidoreductase [Pelagibacterium xiamenense]|uniref:SDR family NAD(P)-dependent oxidoreductase n=1 Tax=Pelagibacterium xiamenense TaxID=2901140 RepID=UPI001E40533C|nr:SDR family NAD(P)-dependent oxidoreductase [Pelagibacterium xiamenense]MCD7059010.1 SDR family NAD(P)-dependent oxidoreductase [Pelagibacterium xiamenense]